MDGLRRRRQLLERGWVGWGGREAGATESPMQRYCAVEGILDGVRQAGTAIRDGCMRACLRGKRGGEGRDEGREWKIGIL